MHRAKARMFLQFYIARNEWLKLYSRKRMTKTILNKNYTQENVQWYRQHGESRLGGIAAEQVNYK